MTAAGPNNVIDLTAPLRRVGGDRQLLCDLAVFFIEDAPQLLGEIENGIAAGDTELVTRSAHSLKSLASNFDAQRCMQIARDMEERGGTSLPSCQARLPDLRRAVVEVTAALRQEFELSATA